MDEPIPQLAPGVAPNTVTDAIELLREIGYVAEFELVDDHLVSNRGEASCRVEEAAVEHLFRFEGPTDPGDEMIVFGLRDPATGIRGTLACAFGPAADPALAAHLADLSRRFR